MPTIVFRLEVANARLQHIECPRIFDISTTTHLYQLVHFTQLTVFQRHGHECGMRLASLLERLCALCPLDPQTPHKLLPSRWKDWPIMLFKASCRFASRADACEPGL